MINAFNIYIHSPFQFKCISLTFAAHCSAVIFHHCSIIKRAINGSHCRWIFRHRTSNIRMYVQADDPIITCTSGRTAFAYDLVHPFAQIDA